MTNVGNTAKLLLANSVISVSLACLARWLDCTMYVCGNKLHLKATQYSTICHKENCRLTRISSKLLKLCQYTYFNL
jgi:hypothetical protein